MASAREFEQAERAMLDVQRRSVGNTYCADCGHNVAEFVNLTVGTFICKNCADVHKDISNRRIKDIYGRDLTEVDVRRMTDVGNDKANRRFLATWDSNEFPEPNHEDRERLLNFIWLKYEGSWKKTAPPPQPRDEPRYERPGQGGGYGREQDLFRHPDRHHEERQGSAHNPSPPRQRSVWAERLGFETSSASHPSSSRREPIRDDYRFPPQEQQHSRFAHERSRAGNGNRYVQEAAPPIQNRFATSRGSSADRFRPPVPPISSYGGHRTNQQSRYREEYDEEYDRRRNSGHHRPEKRSSSTRKKKNSHRYESDDSAYRSGNGNVTSEDSSERGRERRKKSKSKSRKDGKYDKYVETSEEEGDTEEDYEEHTRKKDKKGKKSSTGRKKSSKKKKASRKEVEEFSSEEESEDDDTNSIPSTNLGESGARNGDGSSKKAAKGAKAEFDLMSDWMGSNNDVVHASPVPSSSTSVVVPPAQPQPHSMPQQQVHMQQMPMAPMSVYGGMMTTNPAAAYVTGMPYYGMPVMGMAPAPMFPQMQPGLVSGMGNMSIAPPQVPSQHPATMPQMVQQTAPPPPPPPPQNQMHQPGTPVPPPPPGPPPS